VIGTTLDKYEILQKVGEGGMATVYRGRHATLDREVAIKVLHPHLSSSTRNRKRFAREARAIEHLRHPNILEIFDYSGADSPDCYIVTEYVRGETLTELLQRCQRVPSEVATLIGVALCEALGYAHKAGVLHRDLKPDNVMIRHDGRVKLMDFGIARFLDESQLTMTGALVGSPAFMSPEQAREDELDARSDLFSLGTVLFQLVTGTVPFGGNNPSLVLRNIIEGNRPQVTELAPNMSATLGDVIERLLSVHREDRYADAGAAADALRGSLTELGIDPSTPRWSLVRFLDDPAAYEQDLDSYLREALLERGRAVMQEGDALAGLRFINRLLSMDEANQDALALLQQFHGLEGDRIRRPWGLVVAGAAMLVLAPLGAWGLLQSGDLEVPTVATTEQAAAAVHSAPEPVVPSVADVADVAAAATPMSPLSDLPAADPAPVEPPSDTPQNVPSGVPPAEQAPPPPTEPPPPGRPPGPRPPITTAVITTVPPPAPAEASAPPSDAPACVAFRSLSMPADVYLDGTRFGTTRDRGCRELPAGSYTFQLRGPLIEEKTVHVDLKPGELRDRIVVELVSLPARVRFSMDYADTCTASVDGRDRGELRSLGHTLLLERPDKPHDVALRCGGRSYTTHYERLSGPDVWFTPEDPP
jgi:tRNA A-37 threonylcarbamoyl transferase component Bud32